METFEDCPISGGDRANAEALALQSDFQTPRWRSSRTIATFPIQPWFRRNGFENNEPHVLFLIASELIGGFSIIMQLLACSRPGVHRGGAPDFASPMPLLLRR